MIFIYLFIIAYLLSWLVLLIHCISRKTFYPIFANSLQTKIFWLLTFVFFNPLLTLLYFIFGFLMKPLSGAKQLKLFHTGSIIALVLTIAIVIVLEFPFPVDKSESIVLTDEDIQNKKINKSGLSAHLAVIRSKDNFNLRYTSSHCDYATVCARNICIFSENPHPLLDSVARKLQLNLLTKPYINKVTYYPNKISPPPGKLLPDICIRLDISLIKEFPFPLFRKLTATVISNITNNAYSNTYYGGEEHLVHFNFNGTLDHKSTLHGMTTPSAKYKLQSEKIAQQIYKQFTDNLNKMIRKHGLTQDMPEYLYGKYHQPPELAIIKPQNSQMLLSGFGLMINNQTVWRLTDNRDTVDILRDCYEQLTSAGWKGPKKFNPKNHDLSLEKDNARLQIFCERQQCSQTLTQAESKPLMIVHYNSRLTPQQLSHAVEKLGSEPLDYQSLFSFQNLFRKTNQRDRWWQLIEQFPPTSTDQYLYLAERYQENDPDKAKINLIYARAMEWSDDNFNSKKQRIKKLAEKLGDESLAKTPITPEIFTHLGFIDITGITTPVEYQRQIGQPLSFFNVDQNGEPRAK